MAIWRRRSYTCGLLMLALIGVCVLHVADAQGQGKGTKAPVIPNPCQQVDCKEQANRSKHPVKYNCRKYVECVGVNRRRKACPEGQVFSNGDCSATAQCEQACESDNFYICGQRIACLTFGQRTFMHPEDCHLYFTCNMGKLSMNICPSGERFDKVERKCKPSASADCVPTCDTDAITTAPTPTVAPTPQPTPSPVTLVPTEAPTPIPTVALTPSPTTVAIEESTPEPTQAPDITTEPTTLSTTTTTTTVLPPIPPTPCVTPNCEVPFNGKLYPIPGDCSGFYQCDNGGFAKHRCANGTSFDMDAAICITDGPDVKCQPSCSVDPVPKTTEPTTSSVTLAPTEVVTEPDVVTNAEIVEDSSIPPTTAAGTPAPGTPADQDDSSTVGPGTTEDVKISPKVTQEPTPNPTVASATTTTTVSTTTTAGTTTTTTAGPATTTTTVKTTTTPGPVTPPPTPAPTTEPPDPEISQQVVKTDPDDIMQDNTATFRCRVVMPREVLLRDFNITEMTSRLEWTLDGHVIRNGARASITTRNNFATTDTITSTVIIKRMRPTDRELKCAVYSDTGVLITEQPLEVRVLGRPRVRINSRTDTVGPGETVFVACRVETPSRMSHPLSSTPPKIEWFRDGHLVQVADDGILEIDDDIPGQSHITVEVHKKTQIICITRNKAGSSNVAILTINVIANKSIAVYCEEDTERGIVWPRTIQGGERNQLCRSLEQKGQLEGDTRRECVYHSHENKAEWSDPDYSQCTSAPFREVTKQISAIEDSLDAIDDQALIETADTIKDITNTQQPLLAGDLLLAVDAINKITEIRKEQSLPPPEEEFKTLMQASSNLLSPSNKDTWENVEEADEEERATDIMRTVDIYTGLVGRHLQTGQQMTVSTQNIYIMMEAIPKSDMRDVTFPDPEDKGAPTWSKPGSDTILMTKETMEGFQDDIEEDSIKLSGTYFRSLGKVMPTSDTETVNSYILSFSIVNLAKPYVKMDPPVNLQFTPDKEYPDNMTELCHFWNYSIPTKGAWSRRGCTTILDTDNKIRCECDHLTNFAILVSPSSTSAKHHYILSMISLIGCIVSSVALLLTMLFYCSMWKAVKSHHAAVLINLCIALLIGNVLFIAGVERTQNKIVCTIIAALLHYFWLAAFFIMLVEGIQLLLYIIYVFHVRRKRDTAALLFGGWMFPAVIVGISLAITQMEGYGNDEFCWLSPESGLLWAFVGPLLVIVLINMVILVIVLRRAMSAKIPTAKKKKKNKLRSAVWNILVITPLLGVTWVLGVFSVNDDTVFFQYFFAVSNSLQGLFIFIFHALCNKKKGRYALKDTTPSKSKKSLSAQKNSSGQSSNRSTKNNVNGNAVKPNGNRRNFDNGITKIDLHSAPSYNPHATFSSGKNPGYQQQLSDGSEINRAFSMHETGDKSQVNIKPNDQPPEQLNHLSADTASPNNALTSFNVAPTSTKPEMPDKKIVLNRQKLMSSSSSENGHVPVGVGKVDVVITPIKPPDIDTSNLMASPDWPEMVQHLPDDVAEDLISSSRPEGDTGGLLLPPPIDSRLSLSSTPTRLESDDQVSITSSIVSNARNEDMSIDGLDHEGGLEADMDYDGEERHLNLPEPELDISQDDDHLNDVISLTSLSLSEHRPLVDDKRSLLSLPSKLSLVSTSSKQEHSNDEPELHESFDPPPCDYYPFAEGSISTLNKSTKYDSDHDDLDLDEGHSDMRTPSALSERRGDVDTPVPSSYNGSITSIPSRLWADSQSMKEQPSQHNETHIDHQEVDDIRPENELPGGANTRRPPVAPKPDKANHADVQRTSSYLPPMPADIVDTINYRQSIELPPPPSPEQLWVTSASTDYSVPADDIPLVGGAATVAPSVRQHPAPLHITTNVDSTGLDNQGYVHPRYADSIPENEYHPLVDKRASLVSTIPPSPTTTTTDVSWTSDKDMFRDQINSSHI